STSDWVTLPKLSENVQALPTRQANSLVDTLHGSQQTHWEVTSLAMTVNEAPVTWYLAGTSTQWDGQPMVVVVVLEHDAPLIARQIGQSLLNEALQLGTINK
ncbi:MAG: hypothetical protein ACOX7C_00650, partial [Brevefilum sp.]